METRVTNRRFAETDTAFQKACLKVDLKPTTRQVSKWRRKKGKAYTEGK